MITAACARVIEAFGAQAKRQKARAHASEIVEAQQNDIGDAERLRQKYRSFEPQRMLAAQREFEELGQ